MSETLATYTLEVLVPSVSKLEAKDIVYGARVVAQALNETEENVTDLLPEGWSVRIREWDAEEDKP